MKKINIKLTLSLVSLFIGLLFCVLGNNVKVCLSFGLIFLAVAVELFALYKSGTFMKSIEGINEEMLASEVNLTFEKEYKKERKKLKKQNGKIMIMFTICAVCLVVVAIINLF